MTTSTKEPTAMNFFAALYPELEGHLLELRKLPTIEQIWCKTIEEAVTAATDPTRNVFFGICLRSEKKGDEDHAALMPAFWADIDLKDFGGDKQKAADRIMAFPCRPSAVVRTGGGSHLYWFLKEAEEITPKNRPYLRGLLLGVAGALGGDPACRDLARVLRVPGTLHLKRKGKLVCRTNCPSPVLCQIISWHPERRYNPCDFDFCFVEDKEIGRNGKAPSLGEIPAELPEKFLQALEADPELRDAWEGKRQPPTDKSRSGYDAMLAALLARRGFAPEDSAAILRQYPHGKGIEGSMPYLSRTIAHARVLVEESGERRERAATRLNLTDVGNGQRLATQHGRNLRYDHTAKRWYAWDGKRWSPDARGQVETWAKDTARSIYEEAAQESDPDRRASLAKHATRTEARRSIEAMIALCASEPDIPVLAEDLDADPWLFNVQNGTIDLRNSELRPHRREDLLSKIAPVIYDPGASCRRWEQFISEIMADDPGLIAFLRRTVGASLAGVQRDHILLLLYGAGANGKSTFIETLLALFGDYGHQASTSTFLEQRNEGIRTDIADLRGARFVSAVETKQGRRLDEALVKALTGGDTVRARHLYQEAFSFKPQFTCWLATNHKPEIREQTNAIWRRLRLIPFEVSFAADQQDKDLPAKLREELPGIFTWALAGCHSWQAEGLGEPSKITAATAEYREESDILAEFLAEKCTVRPGAEVMASELYRAYVVWCQAQGEGEVRQRTFGKMLGERGFRRQRGTGGRYYYQGIAFAPGERSEPSDPISGKFSYSDTREKFPEKGSLHSLGSLLEQVEGEV